MNAQPPRSVRMTLSNPNFANLLGNIEHSASLKLPCVKHNCHADAPGFVVCGTAPSLIDELPKIRELADQGFIVIAVKEAVLILTGQGIKVHYSVAMDPDARQIEKTPIVPGVVYCLASSCSPKMFEHVMSAEPKVEVLVFHSACGVSDAATGANELDIYQRTHGFQDVMMGGFTVVNRATALAAYMGAKMPIRIAATQFGTRTPQDVDNKDTAVGYYADGVTGQPGNKGPWFRDNGKIDGTEWWSKLDMMASAQHLAKMVKAGNVEFLGDSVAASLAKHPDEFIDQVARKESVPVNRPPKNIDPSALVKALLTQMRESFEAIEAASA